MNTTISKVQFVVLALMAFTMIHCSKGGSSAPAATTCPANQQYTTAGCLPTCGVNMVYYGNSCVSAAAVTGGIGSVGVGGACNPTYVNGQYTCTNTGIGGIGGVGGSCPNPTYVNGQYVCPGGTGLPIGGGIGGIGGIGGVGGAQSLCQGSCGVGMVMTFSGCMPQGMCGPCYGQNNGSCFAGINACQYYYGQPGTSCLQ